MAIDTLVDALEANGRKRAADILREGRAEMRRIRERADREEARRRGELLAGLERELRAELSGEMARVRGEGRRAALEARRELLERVFERARDRLPSALGSTSFRGALPARLKAASRYLPEGEAVVSCPPELEALVRSAVASHEPGRGPGGGLAGLEVEPDPGVGTGFRLRSRDGGVVVDDTLDGRLARRRPELEIAILERLPGVRAEGAS